MPCATPQQQRGGRPQTDAVVGGDQADQYGRHPHDHQRQDQHASAADAVAGVPEDHAAQRPGDEAHGKSGIGEQGRDQESPAGKYSLLNTMPATTPYRKKSYHSMVAPITEAVTTLRTCERSA